MTTDGSTDNKTPDKIIEDLGGCGRYQMRMCVISHIMKTLICWSTMSIVIITKTPDFWCDDYAVTVNRTSKEDVNMTTDFDAQESCVNINDTMCTKFKYDESVIRSLVSELDLVCDSAFVPSTLMSIQSAGTLVGNLGIGQISDLFGRKFPFFGSVLLVTLANFVTLASRGWVLVAICKFFVGMGAGAFMTTTYSLMSEFTLAGNRVWIIGFPSWPLETCMFCLVAWLVKDWRYMTLACAIVGVPCLFAWWVIPESFRWLLAHGRQKEAEKILEVIANYNDKPYVESKRLEEIAAAEEVEKDADRKYTFLDMFKSKYLIRVTILLAVTWFGLGFIGYGITFGLQELSGSIYLNLFLFNIVSIPSKGIAIWTQNRFGRKITAIICYGGTAIACFVVGIVQNIDTEDRDTVTNVCALLVYNGMAMLWGPIQTMTIELYPTVIRSIGFGTLSVLGRIGSILGPQFVFLGKFTGIGGFMYFGCGIVATLSFLSLFGVPETKDAYLSDKIGDSKTKATESKTERGDSKMGKVDSPPGKAEPPSEKTGTREQSHL